ncbi:hypothetical protein SBOR_8950 [Sclerotinia borealis F-4128]|uniref:Uncharacterized protein n=1 Tax=Sclerotinia borealis (strain F-4128) TaxID=1432307 RepID=W9C7W0_SCLBF|nr:hypothetical protein SBOR_8950 [Sclerotinia borealis F-4128]
MPPNAGGGRPYTREELIFLRDSPLVVKPAGLLSTAEWMGQTPDTNRNTSTKISDRTRDRDANPLLEHTSRRPRNSANPESIQLVPTRTTFSSANPARNTTKGIDSPDRPALRESDSQSKLSFRTKIDDSDDRPRRDTLRLKPGDGVDPEGWMEVKPRKSFGTEGAERFTGRMGGDRHREEKRFKDREERDPKERPRGFENFSREKDKNHEQDNNRRIANVRGRTEPSWFRESNDGPPTPRERNPNAEKFENRHKGWREKESENRGDRGDRGDRRWGDRDRDHDDHNRSLPEWAAEDKIGHISPQDDYQKSQTSTGNNSRKHTAEDMQKWKESMHSRNKPAGNNTAVEEVTQPKVDDHPSLSGIQKSIPLAPLDTGTNGDEFFRLWATPKNDTGLASKFEASTESMVKSVVSAPGGKTSRFNKFFNQDEPSRKVEPQTAIPRPASHRMDNLNNNGQSPADKEAMPMILAMLQSSGTPPANPMMQPKPILQEKQPGTPFEGRDPSLQHLPDRHDEMRSNAQSYSHNLYDLNAQRESSGSQPTVRPEEMLHHLVNQRQHAISQSSFRAEPPRSAEQTAFLMSLMRDAQAAPEPQRTEQVVLGHPPRQQPSRQLQHQQQLEREQELQAQRERGNPQRRPPGFFDESIYRGGPPQHDNPRPQPTHILPRPPPGLEQLQQVWPGQPSSQHPPPQQFRPTAPPGLAGNVPRPMQMPQQILPPGFQMAGSMNNFPPPEALAGPRNMPFNPAYFNGPPPGFLPPVMTQFSAEGMPAFPFDARGPPPQGAFRRQ